MSYRIRILRAAKGKPKEYAITIPAHIAEKNCHTSFWPEEQADGSILLRNVGTVIRQQRRDQNDA